MTEHDIFTLKSDEAFRRLIPPLSLDEQRQLEESLVREGCREPLCVWAETILDGHHRYEICIRLKIPFKVAYIFLKSRQEAMAWICANQLASRNLTEATRHYLIGKRYKMDDPSFNENIRATREQLAREYRISSSTVQNYGIYARAIDSLSATVPELISKVLSNHLEISNAKLIQLSHLAPSDIQRVSAYLLEESESLGDDPIIQQTFPRKKHIPKPEMSPISASSVKDMPVYDPDAEIFSLVLTIPSWVSSMSRLCVATNLSGISVNVRCRLEAELAKLKSVVDAMILMVMEKRQ